MPVSGLWLLDLPGRRDVLALDPRLASAGILEMSPAGSPHPVRLELAIPWERYLFFLTLSDPLGWRGYAYSLVGTDLSPQISSTAPTFDLGALVLPEIPPLLVAYERRITHQDTPLALVTRWHPVQGTSMTITGLEADPRKGSVHLIHTGLALLEALVHRGGRPPDIEDKATFWRLYWEAYHKVAAEQQRRGTRLPTRTDVATEMLMTRKTLYRYRVRHHLAWPPPSPPEN